MSFINIGFGNIVNSDMIVAIVSPDSAPSKRLLQKNKEENRIIDATQGRRTKSLIVTTTGNLVLSALLPDTIAARAKENNIQENEEYNDKR